MDKAEILPLSKGELFCVYSIASFLPKTDSQKRLFDLGFVKNSKIILMGFDVLKSSVAVKIRNSVFCLRMTDAENIFVRRVK